MIALFSAGLLLAQGLTAIIEPRYRETPRPVVAPAPKRPLGATPLALLRSLQSQVASERAKAFEALGLTVRADSIPEVQFRTLNLDADPELEAVLVIATPHSPGASAHIFDFQAGGWWEAGTLFTGGGRWEPRQAERLISFRQIVDYPQWDIVVRRQTASGSGVSTDELALYRMQRGSLYRTFVTVESHYEFVVGGGAIEQEVEVEPKDDESRKPPLLVVRSQTSNTSGESKPRRQSSCETWRWNNRQFQFVIDASARAQCQEPRAPSARL
ncbi:MAG: hypothetical protein IT162_19085 [Bryobacterales bacterium]|nr:hypothetical protein [Bryobacterales bacterium]